MKAVQKNQVTSEWADLGRVRCLYVQSLTGVLHAKIDGEAVTLVAKDKIELPLGMTMEVSLRGEADTEAVVLSGFASIGAGGSAGGALQSGSGSPEGVKDAGNGQSYYDTDSGGFWVNPNTSGTTGWVQLIA